VCALRRGVLELEYRGRLPSPYILNNDKNLQQWVDEKIKDKQVEIRECETQIDKLNVQHRELQEAWDRGDWGEAAQELAQTRTVTFRWAWPRSRQDWSRPGGTWQNIQIARKYIFNLLPTRPFDTLALVIAMVLVSVGLKGIFEFGQDSLVGSVVNLSLFDLRNRFLSQRHSPRRQQFRRGRHHELMARFTKRHGNAGPGLKILFGKVVAEPLKALGCVLAASWISWQLTLMFLILVPVALFVVTKVGRS